MPMLGPDTNKKKVGALILAKMSPSGSNPDSGAGDEKSPASSISEGEKSAAEDMIAAFQASDASALVAAFKNMLDIVDNGEGPEPESEKPGFIG